MKAPSLDCTCAQVSGLKRATFSTPTAVPRRRQQQQALGLLQSCRHSVEPEEIPSSTLKEKG